MADFYSRFIELDSLGWEVPGDIDGRIDFDYSSEIANVKRIKPAIEEIIGHPLWQYTSIQDATFFTRLVWLDENFYRPAKGSIRFLNFDRMVTIYSVNKDEKGLMQFESQIVDVLTENGYKYVPMDILNKKIVEIDDLVNWTWFDRFFTHL